MVRFWKSDIRGSFRIISTAFIVLVGISIFGRTARAQAGPDAIGTTCADLGLVDTSSYAYFYFGPGLIYLKPGAIPVTYTYLGTVSLNSTIDLWCTGNYQPIVTPSDPVLSGPPAITLTGTSNCTGTFQPTGSCCSLNISFAPTMLGQEVAAITQPAFFQSPTTGQLVPWQTNCAEIIGNTALTFDVSNPTVLVDGGKVSILAQVTQTTPKKGAGPIQLVLVDGSLNILASSQSYSANSSFMATIDVPEAISSVQQANLKIVAVYAGGTLNAFPGPSVVSVSPDEGTAFLSDMAQADLPVVPPGPTTVTSTDSPSCPASSSINMDSLALQEQIPLVGIPFSLNYSSDRLRSGFSFSPLWFGLGGWTPSPVHHYSPGNGVLYFGDGGIRNVPAVSQSYGFYATNAAGTEIYYFGTDGTHYSTWNTITSTLIYNFTYDSNGRISQISDQSNNTTTFTYSNSGVTITSPYGQQSLVSFDSNGFLASVTNPNNETYSVVNTSKGLLTSFINPLGQASQVTYDASGFVTKDQGAGGDFLSLVRTFDLSTSTQTVTSSTAMNRTTVFQTNASSNAGSSHSALQPNGGTSHSISQAQGTNSGADAYGDTYQAVQAQDPRFGWMSPYSQSSSYSVPGTGINISTQIQKTAQVLPDNLLDVVSLTTSTTLQGTRTYTSNFNSSKQLFTSTSPMNRLTYQTINRQGQPVTLQTGSLSPINLNYDSRGRLIQTVQGGRIQTLTYDQYGNVAQSIDPLGLVTKFSYDRANRVTKETLPDQNVIAMTYDKAGNLTSITPPGKTAHTFSYNLFQLVGQYLPPTLGANLSGATLYSYNLDKQPAQINRPDGEQVSYNYYSSSGLLSSITTPTGNYVYSYSPNSNLLSSVTSPYGETLNYQNAGKFLISSASVGPVEGSVGFSYSADGSLSGVSLTGAKGASIKTAFANDNDGLLVQAGDESLTRNNFGAINGSNLGKLSETLSYDSFGQIVEDKFVWGKKSLFDVIYKRDNLGRVASMDQGSGQQSFQYDKQGRLSEVLEKNHVTQIYSYDANGNRISAQGVSNNAKATYDAQDRLIQYGRKEFTYNANGDLQSKIEHEVDCDDGGRWGSHKKENPKITRYNYDVFGNLLSVTLPNGRHLEYVIDGQNRRVGKKVNGVLVHGFIYQSQTQIAAETNAEGKIVKSFVYGEKSNIPDYMIYEGKEYRIISDQVGTPKKIVEVATGKIVTELSYDEFGARPDVDGDIRVPFGFAGGLKDAETGLVRFGTRDYDPEVGRFVSKDPIGFNGGQTNLYSYTFNDPINFIDPAGQFGLRPPPGIPVYTPPIPLPPEGGGSTVPATPTPWPDYPWEHPKYPPGPPPDGNGVRGCNPMNNSPIQ